MTELEHPKENPFQRIDPDLAGEGTVVVQWIGEKGCETMVAELGGILTLELSRNLPSGDFWKIYLTVPGVAVHKKGISK